MISQIAEAISAFFYSMDVIDEEEKRVKNKVDFWAHLYKGS